MLLHLTHWSTGNAFDYAFFAGGDDCEWGGRGCVWRRMAVRKAGWGLVGRSAAVWGGEAE